MEMGSKPSIRFPNTLVEFRLYGIDAPEIKKGKKLLPDEKLLQLPGQLLMELGNKSAEFLRTLIRKGARINVVQEKGNKSDVYCTQLCYAYLLTPIQGINQTFYITNANKTSFIHNPHVHCFHQPYYSV